MHTWQNELGDEPRTWINYNSDLSGTAEIHARVKHGPPRPPLCIPMADLLAFVAHVVRDARISQLEDLSDARVLGLPQEVFEVAPGTEGDAIPDP